MHPPRRPAAVYRLGLLPLLLASMTVAAQGGPPVSAYTGDAWLDARVADISRYAGRYREPFIDELARYHAAPRDLVDGLLDEGWAPGDVYLACSAAAVAARPCRQVVEQRRDDIAWPELVEALGLKPGSAALARLKHAVRASYERWGRPVPPEPAARPTPSPPEEGKRLPEPPSAPAGHGRRG